MAVIELLPENVTYYKANLHCHTTLSDGKLTPVQMKELYKSRGYQIVAFTDHRRYVSHTELNDRDFLAIAAMESDTNEFGDYKFSYDRIKTYHINWFDMDPEVHKEEKAALVMPEKRYHDVDYINGYVEKMKELGFLACYNHPYWSLQDLDDYRDLRGFWAMEIYNHGCEVEGAYGYNPQAYDEMLRSGQRLFTVATDDNHNNFPTDNALCDSFGGAVMVGARELSYRAVMEALEKGHFYSVISPDGQGEAPRIEALYIEDGRLTVRCSPAARIWVKTQGRSCYKAAAAPGGRITEAQFALNGNEGYIRVTIRDDHGRLAESNACFMDEISRPV